MLSYRSLLRGPISPRLSIAIVSAVGLLLIYTLLGRDIPPHAPGISSWFSGRKLIVLEDDIAWSDFSYCTYAIAPNDLCNSVKLLSELHEVGARADRLLLYNQEWDVNEASENGTGSLLRKARDVYGAKIQSVGVLRPSGVADPTWAAGFTKLLAFNQTQYKRVMTLDSDAIVRHPMDELFLLPKAAVAMPRAYWLDNILSDQMALVQPSHSAFARIEHQIEIRGPNDYDMEIINTLYKDSCAIIPHRPYNFLSGELRSKKHGRYLSDPDEVWDSEAIVAEAKFIHFSDWPLPKPWLPHHESQMQSLWPECNGSLDGTVDDCADRRLWVGLYTEFRRRREDVCGAEYKTW